MKKEVMFGTLWGLTIGLIVIAFLFSVAKSAELQSGDEPGGNVEIQGAESPSGDIDISISGDSVIVNLDKDGEVTSVTVLGDSLSKTPSGIKIESELRIEDGKIYIDGKELNEEQLNRLSINQDQETVDKWDSQRDRRREIKRRRLATAYSNTGDMVKFKDITIDSSMTVRGDVASISGDINVYGEIDGDLVSVFGDIYLHDGAVVHGDVSAPFGDIHRDSNVEITGKSWRDKDREKEKKNDLTMGLSARFNRVEGFTFLPSMMYKDKQNRIPEFKVDAAYAVTLKRWEYDFGVKHRIGQQFGPYFQADLYQWAKTPDSWRFSQEENTMAGLFFKEDYNDFYWARGFSGKTGLFFGKNFEGGVTYTAERISNLKRTAKKAILGGNKKFRENWSTELADSASILAMAGDLQEFGAGLAYHTWDDEKQPSKGISASLDWTKSLESSDDNFDYQAVDGKAEARIPIGRDQTFNLRAVGGYSDDNLPLFKRYFLGGTGTLRGYDYKEFQGDRLILLNADYIWTFYHSDLGAGLFFDSGKAAFGGKAFNAAPYKSDIGVSFLIEDSFRIDLAQRLDDLDKSPVVFARFQIFM
jgi:cytoskeletal protein CcmA (bactofilin family)